MKLAHLFSDHAVLQREISVPVWGWTRPLSAVLVKVGPYAAQTLSGADGRFLVRLPPMKAGGPYELEAFCPASGEKAVAQDVCIGEVWLASGQSNMEFTFSMLRQEDSAEVREDVPGLRLATVATSAHAGRQSDAALSWKVAGPTTTPTFSAVAFHFARALHQALGVPVGIVNSSWGGTIIEAWTSRETLIRNDGIRPWIARYEATVHSPEFWARPATGNQPSPFPRHPGNEGFTRGWAKKEFDDGSWPAMKTPGTWTSQGHQHSGIFWFRRSVEIPPSWAGQDLILNLGAADKQDITYFNGEQIGATGSGLEETYWNHMRSYRIPGRLVKAGTGVIAVRVYSFVYDGGLIGPADRMNLAPEHRERQAIPLAGEWKYAIEHNFGVVVLPALPPGPGNPNTPYILFDNMIAPLVPYALRGAIWYQGESNVASARNYRHLMTQMIRDWRHAWGQGDFPFLFVQLANIAGTDDWPLLREAQLQSLSEPHTGMAVAIDIGDANDIHPANKRDVGQRLALWALSDTYGKSVESSGPLYSGMSVEGRHIRIRFSHVAGGLVAKGGPLNTFIIAGEDRQFVPGQAVIDGDSVVVSNPTVAAPCAVRYAWENNPKGCNLYNAAGLPASPFRTDA